MQAAGSISGILAIWSSINDINGLITIDNPSSMIDVKIYVKDFPDPVSETKRVDFSFRIFEIVSNCPNLND